MLSLSHMQNVETGFRAFLSLTFLFELFFFEKRGGLRWGAAVKSSGGAECEAVTLEGQTRENFSPQAAYRRARFTANGNR